ncbi:hypothetical protein P154DRAFT_73025 [Amniculicola lignicola CBS 123094]|uniref:RING-type domain-containing protein n=1 Tax=Amniculicola lignicola CBS 123094 TaxID=1392246 RepID=A0A6A5WS22_9PLEO|nr:hypothetical protein P154DRAFT_73025 [Amniculicola lignicola CBS 123094]
MPPSASASPTTNPRCCDSCSQPRSKEQFCKNHLLPWIPLSTEEEQEANHDPSHHICPICQLPYGSTNETNNTIDTPHRITGLPCTHLFGIACIQQIFSKEYPGFNRCPLCRLEWFQDTSDRLDMERERISRALAAEMHTDYLTARYTLFREPHLEALVPPMAYAHFVEMLELYRGVFDALHVPVVQGFVDALAKINEDEDEAGTFDPREDCPGGGFPFVDPFSFVGFGWGDEVVYAAVVNALQHFRGRRLVEMYLEERVRGGDVVRMLDRVVEAWEEVFGEESGFVSLVLLVLTWVWKPVDGDEDGIGEV